MKTTHLLAFLAFAPVLASAQQAQMKLPDLFTEEEALSLEKDIIGYIDKAFDSAE